MNKEIKIDEEFKIKAKKKQKEQLLLGLFLFIFCIFILIKFTPSADTPFSFNIFLFIFIIMNIFLYALVFIGCSIMSLTSKDNYSYLRISDLIIISLQELKAIIMIFFIGINLWLLTKIHGTFFIVLGIIYIVVGGNFLLLFVFDDTFFRKIYFKIVKIFNLDDTDYNKTLADKVTVTYNQHEKRYIYCKVSDQGKIISYSSNSLDSFRHDFSSDITILGLPLNKELLSLSKEYKKLKKDLNCKNLKRNITYKIDENNNFKYLNNYYCKCDKFKDLSLEKTIKTCELCSKRKNK